MRYVLVGALLLAVAMGGCVWPFKGAASDVGTDTRNIAEDDSRTPVESAQRLLIYAIPLFLVLALVGLALGVYLKNSLAFYGSGACGVMTLFCIVLLTFWKAIAWVGFIVVLLCFIALAVLVSVQVKKMLTSMIAGSASAERALEAVSAGTTVTAGSLADVLTENLQKAQEELGVRKAVNKLRGK